MEVGGDQRYRMGFKEFGIVFANPQLNFYNFIVRNPPRNTQKCQPFAIGTSACDESITYKFKSIS
jgi:hypothetical protein